MDPLSIIDSVIGIIGAITTTYETIDKVTGLPKAFDKVKKDLPLVQKILEGAQEKLNNSEPTDDERKVILAIAKPCDDKAKELKRIFDELETKCKGDQDAKTWARVRVWYHEALRSVKTHRVESLMNDILKGVEKLAWNRVFKLATQEDLKDIKKAIEELSKVEPSLDDSEFDTAGAIHASLTADAGSIAHQYNTLGGSHAFNNGKYGAGGSGNIFNFGHSSSPTVCLKDLRGTDPQGTDPRDDKTRIQDTKGGLLRDAYRWILDHDDFQRWRNDPQSRLFWIKGDPGKGKTMLLCGIIDELEKEPDNCLSYFFCQATEARLNNAAAVLRGLIYLLVIQQQSLVSYVREKHDHAGKQLFEDGNAWEALSKILAAMLNDPSLNGAVLIIDALDECITNRHKLLNFITKPSRIKWIVSSRNWPDIKESLDNTKQKVRLHLELNKDLISKAVNTYIEYKVEKLAVLKKYNTETRNAVQRHLVNNADGTFLWVALVCQELASLKVRKRHTLNTLKSFPPGLDSLYNRMIEYIGNSMDAGLCREVLAITSVVYRPITLNELKVLLKSLEDLDQDDLEEIITSCGSFLTLREGIIYFVHQSAKDFLLNKVSDQILPSGAAHQHYAIFSRSLEALSETLKRDVYDLRVPGFPIGQVSPPDPDPLASIRYSCVFWVDHLDDSEPWAKMSEKDLQDAEIVYDFLRNKYLYWLESLSLLRTMSEGVMALQKLEALVKTKEARLTELLQDARRFILSHKRAIEIAPLQVYASALVFSPTRSLIRELFENEVPNWITLKPSVESDWNACLQTLEGHSHGVTSVAFSADGQRLASGSDDKTVKVWDAATGACVQTLEGHSHWVRSVAFSADGQRLVSGSHDKTVKVWDVVMGICVQTLEGHSDGVRSVAFSADGKRLASGSDDETVKVWNAAIGTCMQTLEGHSDVVRSVTFSADSQRLASGSDDETVKVWNAVTGACMQTLEGHSHWVRSVAFSADGQRLASGSYDVTVKLWDAATGACVQMAIAAG